MAKNKKKLHQRMWFWILLALLLIWAFRWFMALPTEHKDGNVPREGAEYAEVTVDELVDEFSANELRAKDEYLDADVAVTGLLRVIDDDGKYICLYPLGYESLDNVSCYFQNDDQRGKLKEYSKGDTVTVKGKITEIGDFHDLKLEIDCID